MTALSTWLGIATIVAFSSAGDVLLSRAMKQIGDLGRLRRSVGLAGVVRRIFASRTFFAAVGCMALAFFSLLVSLSRADVSLVAPATASLGFVTSALAGKFFLHENVDRRRWAAVLFACAGVALLAR